MYEPRKIQWWWEAIIDTMLAHPEEDKREIAARLRVTPQTIYNITGTDMFQLRFSERREALNKTITEQIGVLTGKVAIRALETMYEKLSVEQRDKVPLKALADITDKTLSHLGYSPRLPGQPLPAQAVQVHVTVGSDVLARAQQRLREVEAAKTISHEPPLQIEEVSSPAIFETAT